MYVCIYIYIYTYIICICIVLLNEPHHEVAQPDHAGAVAAARDLDRPPAGLRGGRLGLQEAERRAAAHTRRHLI